MSKKLLKFQQPLKPFLKWAGGKRWFVSSYNHLFPKKINRYIEPFLGSGAVFFYLRPSNALLGDTNVELIETYNALKNNWNLVLRYLREHHKNHSHTYYYKLRHATMKSVASRAAQFIYLNRTCWNGLYRVNQKGVFNVPVGTKSTVLFENDSFEEISEALREARLISSDFEILIDMAECGDMIFVDPPYTVLHNYNAFIKYNETLFSWSDQLRLSAALKRAKERGAQILGTNAYHASVRRLYQESFKILSACRNSAISSKVESRKKIEELIFFTELKNE